MPSGYSDFDYDAFVSQFDDPDLDDSVQTDTPERSSLLNHQSSSSVRYWELDYSNQDDSRDADEIIYGQYPDDSRSDAGFDPRAPRTGGSTTGTSPRDQRTDTADEQLERERLARARSAAGSLHRQSAPEHGGSDDARRINEQNERAVREAIRRLSHEQSTPESTDYKLATGNPGQSITVPTGTGGIVEKAITTRPILSDDFPGCSFIAGLHRLYLNNNGEWLVQFRVAFESREDARQLDMASGMALEVTVKRV